jgi:amino acid adenylation domain-containing protein
MEGEVMDRLLEYWTKELDGAPTRLDLPADRPRPRRPTMRGDAVRELLPAPLYQRLRAFGRREGFTLFMTMSAAFQALLTRTTGREDFLVGAGIANRRVAEVEPMIGMMVNSLVPRADTSGDPTFRELLLRVRRSMLGAHAHQDMPFERLVEELQPERDPSVNPLFQVMFSFHDAAVPDLSFGGLEAGFLVEHNRSAKTDLNVIVAPRAEQRVGRASSEVDDRAMVTWEFSTDLFDRSTIERLIRHYLTLTDAALGNPDLRLSELPLMPPAERELVLREWSGRRTGYPRDASLTELFAARVTAAPEAPALRFGGRELTYRELDVRAARIAGRLRRHGVQRGTPVALALERGLDLVPAILGVLRAGGFYVPLDAAYPRERLELMLADVAAPVLVTQEALLERLPVQPSSDGAGPTVLCVDRPDPERAAPAAAAHGESREARDEIERPGPDDPAYVIYTSGSTGRPKGVAVPHRAVARLVLEADFATFGPEHTVLQLAPVSFDAATLEIWAPLLTGGCLVVHPPEPPEPDRLGRLLADEGVTTLWLTAGLFHQMVEANLDGLAPLSQLLAGGDVLSPAHCRRVLEAHPHLTLINGYGPTENTTFTCCHRMRSAAEVADPVPIGRPIADSEVFVVDPRLRPVPLGVPGELLTGGDGLAAGYLGRPALTAERFVPRPFEAPEPGARLYRTGDLVRWRPGGLLEFLGRYDSQVKLRGFRIETGEVEQALIAHPAVAEALVTVRGSGEDKALVGYLVLEPGGPEGSGSAAPGSAELRDHLAERLPDHMVPSAFVLLEAFPLDPNGKVDRKALPEPGFERPEETHVAPRNELERTLAGIWTELLPVERVGVRDDFFDLGGHSLAATRIAARIRRDLGADVPLTVLFEEPTVELLARRLETEGAGARREQPIGAGSGRDAAGDALRRSEDPTGDLTGDGADDLSDEELDALLGRMIAGKTR